MRRRFRTRGYAETILDRREKKKKRNLLGRCSELDTPYTISKTKSGRMDRLLVFWWKKIVHRRKIMKNKIEKLNKKEAY